MMRITTSIALAYIWMTASANLLIETGFASALGMPLQYSAGNAAQNATREMAEISAGGGSSGGGRGLLETAGAVLRMARAAGEFGTAMVRVVTAAPRFLAQIGVPTEFVAFVFAPVPFLLARFGLYMITQRNA